MTEQSGAKGVYSIDGDAMYMKLPNEGGRDSWDWGVSRLGFPRVLPNEVGEEAVV